MKAIKVILGIISLITIVFFSTGLIVKETKYTAEIEIDKPLEEVFAKFTDNEFLKEWLPEVKSIETIEEKEGILGSSYKMTVTNQGEDLVMIEKIKAFVHNQKMTFEFDSDQMIKTDDYNFVANGDKTKIIQHCTVKSKGYVTACLFPYFKSTFKELSLTYMNRFKELLEE